MTVTGATTGTENGHAWVDLGLPSGTKWATCNIGASKPEESGSFFAWGETSTKNDYSWSRYKWCKGSYFQLTKYCKSSGYGTPDGKTTLDSSDDAAIVNWGGSWRTPSNTQMNELINYCNWKQDSENGVDGYLVTSKVNGNSIFLPSVGYYMGKSFTSGYRSYWTSYTEGMGGANCLYYYGATIKIGSQDRAYGLPVRAVMK